RDVTIEQYQTMPYTALGYDAAGNPVGDRTAQTAFTISPATAANGATCSANRCTASASGTYTITGTDGSASAQTSLTVTPAPLSGTTFGIQCTSPIAIFKQEKCTFTVANSSQGSVPAPTGEVSASYGGSAPLTCTLAMVAGKQTCSVSAMP